MIQKALLLALASAAVLSGCTGDRHPSDAELGLTPQQAHGRRIYEARCAQCHYAYRSGDLNGPTMKALYRKPYMPSGVPANDERVREVILRGKRMMPGYTGFLGDEQMNDLIAYLRTL